MENRRRLREQTIYSNLSFIIEANANNYIHPISTVGEKISGLYKISTDISGHVIEATTVTKADITELGIPAQDTTYSNVTTTMHGLMSTSDKAKLDEIDFATNEEVNQMLSETFPQ